MKKATFFTLIVVIPVIIEAQGLKKLPERHDPLVNPTPNFVLPNNEPKHVLPFAKRIEFKTSNERQVDSVYRNVYHMETPVFYEPTHPLPDIK